MLYLCIVIELVEELEKDTNGKKGLICNIYLCVFLKMDNITKPMT